MSNIPAANGQRAHARTLRAGIARKIVVAPGAYDPYSALIIKHLGFPTVYLGGNAMGLHVGKGQPFISVTETADIVARVANAVDLPLVVDMGAGFGDAAHCYHAMRDLEHAGAAAVHIDDQVYPKRAHYHLSGGRLEATDVVVGKLKAALAARRDSETMVIARTDVLRETKSLEATIERARAYVEVGVDMLLVLDLGVDNAPALRAALPSTPLAWIGGIAHPVPTSDELARAGFGLALYPFNTIAAATEAMMRTWTAFKSEGRPSPTVIPTKEILDTALRLVDMPTYWDIERRTVEADVNAVDRQGTEHN